jgi:hypothetical protein
VRWSPWRDRDRNFDGGLDDFMTVKSDNAWRAPIRGSRAVATAIRRGGQTESVGRGCPMSCRLSMLWVVVTAVLASGVASPASEVWLPGGTMPDPLTSAPQKQQPVLFVHGHNAASDVDADFNYRKNWIDVLDATSPSFQTTLDENPALDIEPYFIRFVDQDRSIVDDAADIADAVERILARHDPSYVPNTATPSTTVKVAIVAFSKGTISTRLYLKSLAQQVTGLPAPRAGFNPISAFVALSPPNHGIAAGILLTAGSLATRQLNNGRGSSCLSFFEPESLNFIGDLNGHPTTDTATAPFAADAREAPSSRPPDDPTVPGTLYVTLYADGNRDAVGGSTPPIPPPGECNGRLVAKNLAPDARNIEVPEITDQPPLNVPGWADPVALSVHRNTPHTPAVICLALATIVHHQAPADTFRCETPGPSAEPRIPPRAGVVQVLDISGSMLDRADPACTTQCASKLEVLREAVHLFVQLWSVFAGPADRIGTTYFGSQVTSLVVNGQSLLEASPANVTAVLRDLDLLGTNAASMTAMGGGIEVALRSLLGPDGAGIPQRHVLVFTDGMQNRNPIVTSHASGVVDIADRPGWLPSNVSVPLAQPRVLDTTLGVKVHTIGVGATPQFTGLLADIADRTDGEPWITVNPQVDLRNFFVQGVIAALQGNSPQLVGYRRGTLGSATVERFRLERGITRVAFKLSWPRGEKLDFKVEHDGLDVTALGRFVVGPFYRIFVIERPAAGDWAMRLSGRSTVAYEAAAIVDEHAVRATVALRDRFVLVGRPLDVRVTVRAAGRPVTSATVVATVLGPDESAATKAPRVLRLTPSGDGGYAGVFRDTKVAGPYRIVVTVDGRDAKLGDFQRSATVTAVVETTPPVSLAPRAPLTPTAAR